MSSTTLTGSCLCGAVRYEITGSIFAFNHCHCQRCRKSSGTGHASNILLHLDDARWTEGEDLLGGFKVPDAERFRTVFCRRCGSPLPRVAAERGVAVIPAGSLDGEPPLAPTARIFWASRAGWSCEAGAIDTWDTYPPAK